MAAHLSQPMHKSAALSFLPSVLTLRIYHGNRSFSAKSTTQLTARGTNETKCTCSRIPRLWLGANDAPQLNSGLPEIPHRTTVLRFVFRTATNTEGANKLCIRSRESPSLEPFRNRMRKLVADLAAMCEGEHPLDQTEPRSTAGFVPFSPFRTSHLDRNLVNEELRAKIFSPLAVSEVQGHGMGYVYILRSNLDFDALSMLKIGFSKYHPEHRAHELASCLPAPEIVAHTPLMPHAKRVESLIHTELVASRKVRACGQCGSDHQEWFAISHADSREIVIRWSKWILRQPYIDGKLSKEWQSYLQQQYFVSASPEATMSMLWGGILDGFSRQKTDPSPEDQLAAYLNACYWADMVGRVSGASKGSFTNLQNALQDCRKNGGPLEINDFKTAMKRFVSSDLNTEVNPDVIATVVRYSEMPPDPSPRPWTESDLRREHETWIKEKEELRRQLESINNLNTGGFSVSDPEQGITESPLGDATLLPVLSLNALKCLDAPARNWIGYNPTHQGFQMLQEAYQRGEWVGQIPQFKLPRAFRRAGATRLRTQAAAAGTKEPHTPASSGKPGQAKENTKARETKVEFSSGPDGTQLTFSREINDDMIREATQIQEIMNFPLGRALVEKELVRQLRQFGINADGSYEAISSSEESEESSSDDDDKMDIDEPEPKFQRQRPTSGSGPGITKSKAKRWLESL